MVKTARIKHRPLTIGLLFDLQKDYILRPGDPPDAAAEFDTPAIIHHLARTLRELGYRIVKIGHTKDLLRRRRIGCDLVFNDTEGQRGRNRESEAPVILEMMGIPFVGSDGATMALTLDKVLAKKMMAYHRLPTPLFFSSEENDNYHQLMRIRRLSFPLFVKPQYEGSSKGLSQKSKVKSFPELTEQIQYIEKTYRQPALVEQFISGREYTVLLIGNRKPTVYPIVEVRIGGPGKTADRFYTSDCCGRGSSAVKYVCTEMNDNLGLKRQLNDLAVRTFQALQCRDFARVDFRVDQNNNPYVLEINPLPCLAKADVFGTVAACLKIPYRSLIDAVVMAARRRYRLI